MKSNKKALGVLFLVVATELIGFGIIIPVLPQLALQIETSPKLIGILMAAYSFAQFIASPLLGTLSDRFGRRPILILSKLGTVIAYAILAQATHFYGFLFARLLDGFTGGNISVARAYVNDITTVENRSKGMAIIGIGFGTGFVLGPALGGFLYSGNSSHALAAIVAGSLSFIAMLLTLFLLPEPEKKTKTVSSLKSMSFFSTLTTGKEVVTIFGIYFIYMLIFSGFETTFSVFTNTFFNFTTADNSKLFMYFGLLSLVIQGGITRVKVLKLKEITSAGLFIFGLGLLLKSQLSTAFLLFGTLLLLTIGLSFVNTFLSSLLSLYIPEGQSGKIMGFYEGLGSLSRIIGPLVAYSAIIDNLRLGYAVYGCILIASACLLFIIAFRPLSTIHSR